MTRIAARGRDTAADFVLTAMTLAVLGLAGFEYAHAPPRAQRCDDAPYYGAIPLAGFGACHPRDGAHGQHMGGRR